MVVLPSGAAGSGPTPLRTKPSSAIAASTFCRVAGVTFPGLFTTLETVPSETPAARATSIMLGELLRTGPILP